MITQIKLEVLPMLALYTERTNYEIKAEIRGYARVLYRNYRARVIASGHTLPIWKHTSPVVKQEFIRNARTELGY
jgi:hypothetical protein